MRHVLVSVLLLAGCSGHAAPVCGAEAGSRVVTGLNGVIDGSTAAVEVQLIAGDTCEVLDTTWMLWDAEADAVVIGEAPSSGTLDRSNVSIGDSDIFFRSLALGVRLEYPDDVVGPELALTWYTSGPVDLAIVDCAMIGGVLACATRAP